MARMPVYTRRLMKNPGVGSLNLRFTGQTIKLDLFPLWNSFSNIAGAECRTTKPLHHPCHAHTAALGYPVWTSLHILNLKKSQYCLIYSIIAPIELNPHYLKEEKSLTETDIRHISLWGTFYLLPKFSASERLQISWRSAGDLVERSYLQIFKICKWLLPGGKKNSS